MKKLFLLLSIFILLCNCTNHRSSATQTKDVIGSDEEKMEFKTDYKKTTKKAFTIVPVEYFKESEKKGLAYNAFLDNIHEIQAPVYERNVATYKESINQGGTFYYVKDLNTDEKFKKLVRDLNSNTTENEYIRFDLPKTKIAKDITYDVAKNGFCDFGDTVSVFHEKFLEYLLDKKYKEFKIIKGREMINTAEIDNICPRVKKNSTDKEFTEAQIYLLLDDGTEKYYNLSHIPPSGVQYSKK
ncbi:MAG TPA: hypothetical protein DIT10_06405 [Chryseobacterium sp.]|uniref:hypothetical protein n=1 Tax=Chryseobacterium lactis TaxID=1241981 RepID=UPI000ECBBCA2|nr:hypothetical protein [Chryseobacterium lactis]HCN48712.1 hypothetical protein [Chryseobacterium sp.]